MHKFIPLTFSTLLLLPAMRIHAEINQYNVEIVIFEDSSSRYINSEQWPVIGQPEPELYSDAFTVELEPLSLEAEPEKTEDSEINSVIDIANNTSYILNDHVKKLNRSTRYNVLLHQSWQQTGLDSTNAVSMPVDTSEKSTAIKDITVFSNNSTVKTNDQNSKSSIQGSIKLILGRYLHIHADLNYKRINKSYRPNSPILDNRRFHEYKIKAERRMRSNELHYIDHPLLGILVIVTPIKSVAQEEKTRNLLNRK
ncbi:MAG: peptidoglycan binding protein CsiV [Gammaproteobacteria bacterium]|nr:peptidoglycan binding protein CsiV [Gammaproteobacteria bacterium]